MHYRSHGCVEVEARLPQSTGTAFEKLVPESLAFASKCSNDGRSCSEAVLASCQWVCLSPGYRHAAQYPILTYTCFRTVRASTVSVASGYCWAADNTVASPLSILVSVVLSFTGLLQYCQVLMVTPLKLVHELSVVFSLQRLCHGKPILLCCIFAAREALCRGGL